MMSGLTSPSVFLEFVVREVERENFVRIPPFDFTRISGGGGGMRESIIFAR